MLNLMSFSPTNFGRYVSQTSEYPMDESNGTNEQMQAHQKGASNHIPPLMSISVISSSMTTNSQQKPTVPASVIKENIEPLPFPQHGLGPIQRPTKLSYLPTAQTPSFFNDIPQSPGTPDVLVAINHLVDHQNSIPSTPIVANATNSSTIINDISAPTVPWTPFSPTEWSSKYDSSWPLANMQTSNVSLSRQIQNPFVQRQITREELSVWSSTAPPTASGPTSLNEGIQNTAEWNELFSSAVPTSIDSTKPIDNTWLQFLPATDAPSVDSITANREEAETTDLLWNPIHLSETQENSSTAWWPKTPSNENNTNNDNDQSRWDFAH